MVHYSAVGINVTKCEGTFSLTKLPLAKFTPDLSFNQRSTHKLLILFIEVYIKGELRVKIIFHMRIGEVECSHSHLS